MSAPIVLFDLDGTVLTWEGAAPGPGRTALERAAAELHAIDRATEGIRLAGGTDRAFARAILRRAALPEEEAAIDALLEAYVRHLEVVLRARRYVAVGAVAPSVDALRTRGATIGVATGNTRRGARLKLASAGLEPSFDLAYGAYGCEAEPRAAIVRLAVERCGVGRDAGPVVVVGDTAHDVAAARRRRTRRGRRDQRGVARGARGIRRGRHRRRVRRAARGGGPGARIARRRRPISLRAGPERIRDPKGAVDPSSASARSSAVGASSRCPMPTHVHDTPSRPAAPGRHRDALAALLRTLGRTGTLLGVVACSAPQTGVAPTSAQAGNQPANAPATDAAAGVELLERSSFQDQHSLPWMTLILPPAAGDTVMKDGAYCARVDQPGKHPWDVQVRHRGFTIEKGHAYTVRFSAWASAPARIGVKVGMSGAPYTSYWGEREKLTTTRQAFVAKFQTNAPDDPTAELAFHLNDPANVSPITICFDDLHLTDPQFVPQPRVAEGRAPPIRANQVGYPPHGEKHATWVLEGKAAEAAAGKAAGFELVDASGAVVDRGETQPFGKDPTSGLFVQRLDFSSYAKSGAGLRLRVAAGEAGSEPAVSDPFAIGPHLLTALARDALRYFYLTRSGIPLEMPYVEDPKWARAAGHPTDAKVPCAPDAGCTHVLDVSGGWYDAGDYGKYVVNGGLSAWLLLDLWEVSRSLPRPVVGARDRNLNVPESGNGQPDLLDEARWELEWMLKMQVPEGDPQAGLVHHKVHDVDWSSLGTLPILSDSNPRQLRPVSTAATLNLAAAGAQAARVFAALDPTFAARCLRAARRAWAAVDGRPPLLIPPSDTKGGGAYEDDDVSDERYWAAAELYVTTGDKPFLDAVRKSPHDLHPSRWADLPSEAVGTRASWRETDVLGTMTLALDARRTPPAMREANRKAIVQLAETYVAMSRADAFGQPYSGTHYPWGSNSFILSDGVVLAFAHFLTKDPRFLEGASAALDYVLGRNALGKSYVSGYGARPLEHPHHRFWAHQADAKFPPPPPGIVSGGPNSDLQDPYSKAASVGCIGQMCYVDHIEAYGANEVAINWNAELAWLVAYLDACQ